MSSSYKQKTAVALNIVAMIIVAALLITIAMWGLDIWTAHGKIETVPDVRNLTLDQARDALHKCNLKLEVTDSIYNKGAKPGSVADQIPPAGNHIKPGRTVYLTINAFTTRKITLPEMAGISLRQAQATLQSLGFTNVRVMRVPSDYRDLVITVKSMGVSLRPGTRLSPSAPIIIEAGDGNNEAYSEIDSIAEAEQAEAPQESEWWGPADEEEDSIPAAATDE